MIIPRPAQALAIPAARKALREDGRALVVLASALGKMIASALIWRGFKRPPGLFLAHTNGILDHAISEYRKVYGTKTKLALYNGQSKEIEGAHIIFATFQTMVQHLTDFSRNRFHWMTVDESHHAQARTWRRVIEHFICPRLGITATPDREDMLDIRQIFGPEVISISFEEAIARGWLPNIEYHLLADQSFDVSVLERLMQEVIHEGQRPSLRELNRRLFVRARDEEIARIVEGYAQKTIVFCSTIEHAEHFRPLLSSATTYHSRQSDDRNRITLRELRRGDIQRVLAVDAFNEGIDVPEVGLLVFNRSTQSERIFKQQLGRGLRPVKDKLIVLDFVGNIERVIFLKKMSDRLVELQDQFLPRNSDQNVPRPDSLHLSGAGFDFTFSDTVVSLMEIVRRVSAQFYPTWQEAGTAARDLGITKSKDYGHEYKRDVRLSSKPEQFYVDFPGWRHFLGKSEYAVIPKSQRYQTWQEAGAAARKLGAESRREYPGLLPKNSRLTAHPQSFYSDFPGWLPFLGKTKGGKRKRAQVYAKWEAASVAAQKLGLKTATMYRHGGYLKDPKLPGEPWVTYPDFPGWDVFLEPRFYLTWQEAGKAARSIGIGTSKQFSKQCKKDPRLPSDPKRKYQDFPGWDKFLGRLGFYPTWRQAAKAAKKLGLTTTKEYRKGYKSDPRLPAIPERYEGFPGRTAFFGKKTRRQECYPTWQEAGEAARALGIRGDDDYKVRYKEDSRLPSTPRIYRGFPGFKIFLGKTKRRPI